MKIFYHNIGSNTLLVWQGPKCVRRLKIYCQKIISFFSQFARKSFFKRNVCDDQWFPTCCMRTPRYTWGILRGAPNFQFSVFNENDYKKALGGIRELFVVLLGGYVNRKRLETTDKNLKKIALKNETKFQKYR